MSDASIINMYLDYVRGMEQREMERKYDKDIRQITRKIKKINMRMFHYDSDSFINKNIEKIKKDIEASVHLVNICPHCGQHYDFLNEETNDNQTRY
jgi:hypothetical protein